MKTETMLEAPPLTDTRLVELSLEGDREAFGLAVVGALPLLATPAEAALMSATAAGARSSSLQAFGTGVLATVAYLPAALGAA